VRRLTTLMVVVLFAVAACSGSTSNRQPVADRLVAAKKSFDDAKFIGFTLSSDHLPGGVSALESAHGTGTHAPAFTGSVQVMKGLSIDAGLVAVDGAVYAKLPFVGWSKINPADYGAPDPAALMNRRTGISSLLTDTVAAKTSGSERSGSTILTKVDGHLPGKYVHALFSSSALTSFKVTFTLTDGNALHGVSITGPFYGDHGDCTYSIIFDLTADPVTITAPQ
jgi:lipoprotein LprG